MTRVKRAIKGNKDQRGTKFFVTLVTLFALIAFVRTLFLNIASADGLIACADENEVRASVGIHHCSTDADLVQSFEQVLNQAGWKPEELERVACVVGPGGFTSLRVACAFANALSHFQRVPLAGVQLSEVYGSRSSLARPLPGPPGHPSPVAGEGTGTGVGAWWLHSTKRDLLFLRGYGRYAEMVAEPKLVMLDELDLSLHAEDKWMGELIPEHEAQVKRRGLVPAELQPLEQALPAFLNSLTYAQKPIEPWYGRGW